MTKIILNSHSIYNNAYHAQIDLLPEWHAYWLTENAYLGLYQAISDAILNQPYADIPDNLIKHNGTIIYHPNHDVAHAIRQVVNTQFFLRLVQLHGLDSFQIALKQLTVEENEALKLAAFMFRAARTNELGGEADPHNAVRSAELFKKVALALGFNADLVHSLCHCIGYIYTQPAGLELSRLHDGFIGAPQLQENKFNLVKRVLHLSHHNDLVRCWGNIDKISSTNKDNLSFLINPALIAPVAEIILNYARATCEVTGTSYYSHNKTSDRKQPPLALKALAVKNVAKVLETVTQLSESFLRAMDPVDISQAEVLLKHTEEANLPSEKENQAAFTIQRAFFAKRAHQETQQAVNISPAVVSKSNLEKLKNELQTGLGLSVEENIQKGDAILTAAEQALYDFLMGYDWTLKHMTPFYDSIHQDSDRLKSLHQRNRENRFNDQCHTSDFAGRSDNIYFTIGSPDANLVNFLRTAKGHEISIPLSPFLTPKKSRLSDQLSGLWLSSSWNLFLHLASLTHTIGTTLRKVQYKKSDPSSLPFIEEKDYKLYQYQRKNGAVLERKVYFSDETVTGSELLPFLALNVILELRLIGDEYRQHCLENLTNATLAPLIDMIYHCYHFEALLPSRLNLNDKRIKIKPFNQVTDEIRQRVKDAIQSDNPKQALKILFDEGVPVDVQLKDGITLLASYILKRDFCEKAQSIIRFLIQEGANTLINIKNYHLFLYLIDERQYDIIELILKTGIIDKRDRGIKGLIDLNYLGVVYNALVNQDMQMLLLFKRFGLQFDQCRPELLRAIVSTPELFAVEALSFIKEAGFNAHSTALYSDPWVYTLFKEIIQKNKPQLLKAFLELGFSPSVKHFTTEPSVFERTVQSHQSDLILLLSDYPPAPAPLLPPINHLVHLIIQNDKQQFLVARQRGNDSSKSLKLRELTFTSDLQNPLHVKGELFKAVGIRANSLSYEILPIANGQENAVVLMAALSGTIQKPIQTQEWTDCQWVSLTALKAMDVDLFTQELINMRMNGCFLSPIQDQKALIQAIQNNEIELVNRIVETGARSAEGNVLKIACDTKIPNLVIIEALLKNGYLSNVVYPLGDGFVTPLLLAIMHHRLDLIELLIAYGAPLNQTVDRNKITPLLMAAGLNQIDTVKLLMAKGATFTHPLNQGILVYAMDSQCSDQMFDFLLEHADCNGERAGYTPILVAVQHHHLTRIKALLIKGVDTEVTHPITQKKLISMMESEERTLYIKYAKTNEEESVCGDFENDIIPSYLKITGKADLPDLQVLIQREYELEKIEQGTALEYFFDQLLSDAGLKAEHGLVKLGIVHAGNVPVFTCLGLEETVIAIHKDYLLNPNANYFKLCFAIAHELAFIERMNGQSIDHNVALRIECDKAAMVVCQDGDLLIQYLQDAAAFWEVHGSLLNFYWPIVLNPLGFTKPDDHYYFQERIKAMRLYLAKKPENSVEPMSQRIDPRVIEVIKGFSRKQYYLDYPYQSTEAEQYAYLIEQLSTLNDELFPYEICRIPSRRIKEFGELLALWLSHAANEDKLDALLEKAQDLCVPGFDYLYKIACHCEPWKNRVHVENELQPLGYFKKMSHAMLAFKNASTSDIAVHAAKDLIQRYDMMVEHGAYAESVEECGRQYELAHDGQFPKHRLFKSRLNRMIQWPELPKDAFKNHLQWVTELGHATDVLWKGLWIIDIQSEVLYPFIPKSDLMDLVSKNFFTIHEIKNMPHPFIARDFYKYPSDLAKLVTTYLYQTTACDTSMLKGHPMDEISVYIDANFVHLVTHDEYNDMHYSLAVRQLLAMLHDLACGNPKEQQFVRDFFMVRNGDLNRLTKRAMYLTSEYVVFVLNHLQLFTPQEFMDFMNEVVNYRASIPLQPLLKILGLENNGRPLHRNLFLVMSFIANWEIGRETIHKDLFQKYLALRDKFHIFSYDTIQLFDYIVHSRNLDFINYFLFDKLIESLEWQDVNACKLSAFQCIMLYRIIDERLAFPTEDYRTQFGLHIIQKVSGLHDASWRIELLESLIFVGDDLGYLGLQDREFFCQVALKLTDDVAKSMGMDNGTQHYYVTIKQWIDKVYAKTWRSDAVYIFDQLANKIHAQYGVSHHMGCLIDPVLGDNYIKERTNDSARLAKVFSILSENKADKMAMLLYISSPLTKISLDNFVQHLDNHPNKRDILYKLKRDHSINNPDKKTIALLLKQFYQHFWELNLEARAVVLDSLMITVKDEVSEASHKVSYLEGFNFAAEQLFPNALPNSREALALALLTAYLETADHNERQFLLAGLLVSNNESQGQSASLGRKVALLCEHLGPAYVKLAQAVHSHPDTSEDIKLDLAHVKGRANPPYRWHLWQLINQVVPKAERDTIAQVGALLGSASYNLALEITRIGGEKDVLLLLREHAAEDAAKGFAHLARALTACHHPKLMPSRTAFMSMIEEAEAMSHAELDHVTGKKQHEMAQKRYKGKQMKVTVDETTYCVNFSVCYLLENGPGYRFLSRVLGTEFNDLPNVTRHDKAIRKAVAKAVLEKELRLIFSGKAFDCDRHGNQLRVTVQGTDISLGLYDFGEMSLRALTEEEVVSLAALVYELPQAIKYGNSIEAIFQRHIQAMMIKNQPHHHLMRINKALLALQDFKKELTTDDLKAILQKIRLKLHPKISAALKDGAYETMSYWERGSVFCHEVTSRICKRLGLTETLDSDSEEEGPVSKKSKHDHQHTFFSRKHAREDDDDEKKSSRQKAGEYLSQL